LSTQGAITTLSGSNTGDQTISLSGAVTGSGTGSFSTTLSNDAVASSNILDGTIATADLASSSVTTEKIVADAVTSAKILDATIVNADIATNAAIADSKLADITTAGKVANSATTATPTNTVSSIVARDPSGNFTAGTITAALTGNVSGNATTATTSANLAGGSAGAIAYQSSNGTTTFTGVGTAGQVLKSTGGSAPAWTTLSTSDLSGTISLTSQVTGVLPGANGGTGVDNTGKTITLGGNLTTSGPFGTTLNTNGTTNVTLPLSGTLSTLNGAETLTNKTIENGNATTQSAGDNSTKIATTAFVKSATPDATSGVKGLVQLTNDLGGTAIAPTVNSVGGVSSSTIATIKTDVIDNATASATASTLVKRDATGNFSVNTITGTLSGTASKANSLNGGEAGAIAYQSSNGTTTFTGVGTTGQVLKSTGGSAPTWTSLSLTDINSGTISLTSQVTGVLPVSNGGTGLSAAPTNGQIDIGNGTGFTRTTLTAGTGITITNGAGTITITSIVDDADEERNGKIRLSGDLTGSASTPVIGTGKINSAKIENASILNEDIATTASITDTKLANITTAGKVANSATSATPNNTVSTIVARDASGNFTASTITGTLSGTASKATNLAGTTVGSVPYQSTSGVTSYSDGGSTGDLLIRTSDGMVWATQVAETLSQVSESGNSHTFTLTDTPLAGTKLIVFSSGGSKISNSKISINVKSVTIDTGSRDDTNNYEFYYYK
jgi:hypothetical protein